MTDGGDWLCYVGEVPDVLASKCQKHQWKCGYLLTDKGHEHGSCFDPSSNSGEFYTDGCYNDVDVEMDEDSHHGRFCVCDPQGDDLCNEDFFKNGPNGSAVQFTINLSVVFVLVIYQIMC